MNGLSGPSSDAPYRLPQVDHSAPDVQMKKEPCYKANVQGRATESIHMSYPVHAQNP